MADDVRGRSDGLVGMQLFIGIFTTCDRKRRDDGTLSSVNYRSIARRTDGPPLSRARSPALLDPWISPGRAVRQTDCDRTFAPG